MVSRRYLLKAMGIASGVPILSGCSGETEYEESEANGDSGGAPAQDEKLDIISDEWYREDYSAGVRGTAKNVSGENLSYISIKVKFYDGNEALIESSLDNINDLGPGEKWRFDVVYPNTDAEKVSAYKIGVGEGF